MWIRGSTRREHNRESITETERGGVRERGDRERERERRERERERERERKRELGESSHSKCKRVKRLSRLQPLASLLFLLVLSTCSYPLILALLGPQTNITHA